MIIAGQLIANPKTRKLIIRIVCTVLCLALALIAGLLMLIVAPIAWLEGGSGSAGSVGAGVTGALPITSPGFQKVLNAAPGTIVVEWPGVLPPESLAQYALPGVTVPAIGVPPEPTNGNGVPGQCTYWAEINWVEPSGAHARIVGNADQLVASAESQGIKVVTTPGLGELVVWGAGGGYDPQYGHVAVVVAVNATKKNFVVSEMNYSLPWEIDLRVVADNAGDVMGFLPTGLTLATPSPSPSASPTP